ncbi:MAG: hypothetical protein GF370_03320 [Candidatus Nealsonbacteria bacterium]|nr:hypothetical protein [Candidatus Nealsonbacteria bacterium]
MDKIISKSETEEIMSLEGEARGVAIKEHLDYILQKEGMEGVKKIEDALSFLGYPEYKEIKATEFYPLSFYALTHLAIQRIFGYGEKEFGEMGKFNAKFSLVIRLFMRYFVSLERVANEVSKMWRRYYTVGTLETVEYSLEDRYVILKLRDFAPYPTYCSMVEGYLSALLKIIVKNEVQCKERKCLFQGDEAHEFVLTW